jgi:hypothetical protein
MLHDRFHDDLVTEIVGNVGRVEYANLLQGDLREWTSLNLGAWTCAGPGLTMDPGYGTTGTGRIGCDKKQVHL